MTAARRGGPRDIDAEAVTTEMVKWVGMERVDTKLVATPSVANVVLVL